MYMSMGETKVSRLLLLAMSIAVAVVLLAGSSPVGTLQICGQDATKLELQCEQYVKKSGPKVTPSQACCAEMRKLDIECFCKNIPSGWVISMEKAVFVARSCGMKVPAGIKCGDYVVPPPLRP